MIRHRHHTLAFKVLRRLATALLLALLLTATSRSVAPTPGHAQGPEQVLLYEEHFSTSEPPGWNLNWWGPGEWWVDEDTETLNGSGHAWAYYTNGHWGGDGRYSYRFKLLELAGGMHVNIQVSDEVRYGIGFRKEGNKLLVNLFKQLGPETFIDLAAGEVEVPTDSYSYKPGGVQVYLTHQVEIVTEGGIITVYAEGEQVLTHSDTNPLPPGTIGFETLEGASAQVDDIEVYGPPPTEPPPTEPPPTEPPPTEPPPTEPPPTELPPTEPPPPGPLKCSEGEVLYREDFNDGQAQGWQLEQVEWGRWWVEDDMLNGGGHTWAYYTGGHWGDGCVTFKLKCLEGGLHANVRVSDTGRYAIGLRNEGTVLPVYLFKQLGPDTFIDLADGGIDYYPNTLESEIDMLQGIDVLIETWGGQIQVSVEGYDKNPVIIYTDLDPLPAGTIAFETLDESRACVDDVVVIGQPLTPPPTERPPTRTPTSAPPPTKRPPTRTPTSAPPPTERPPTRTPTSAPPPTERPPARTPTSAPPPTERPPTRTPTSAPPTVGLTQGPVPPWSLYVGGAVVVLGGLGFLIYRMIRPRPERKGRRPSKPPVIPVIPPVRLAKIWLTEGTSGKGRLLPDHEHLIAGTPYSLHLQIQPRGAEGQADEASQAESGEGEKTKLNVVFFSPETDFELERKTETLDLPRRGASNEIHRPIKPLQAGQHRIRACIYYGNVLLQSALMEATVAQRGAHVAAAGPGQGAAAIARTVDYVASTDLVSLEELPQPALNIFTNQTSDASHWIGVFAASEPSGFQLRSGDIHTFGPGDLAERARTLRKLLTKIEGERAYNLAAPPPLSQREQEWREKDLVDLAVAGWKLYHHLFLSRKDRSEIEQLQSFRAALQAPGIVSIARCRRDNATIPWAALYNLYLDTGKQDEIKLCGVFKDQLAANVWSVDQAVLIEKHDLLDNPQACRSQPQCPLADPSLRKLTVCPSGFWGFLHQVEQPLQQVTPTPVDQVPREMKVCRFDQTSFLMSAHDDPVKMAAGVCPDIPDAEQHHAELTALSQSTRLKLVWEKDRDQMLELLERGGHHFYYFYCHGEQEENEFKLKLGPSTSPGYITSDNLDPSEIKWPSQPQPLVILNGCETMALTPELIHDFLGTLRLLGASGIVGTEIKVWTQLARPFGCLVLRHLLHGKSVGEAFLEVRRYFMRQYNPLGLVYTLHAPAPLHLHDPSDCDWCRAHLPAHASGGSG